MTTLQPLQSPDPWPPPAEPPPTEREMAWRRIPLLGWLVAGHLSRRRWWKHYADVLEPIEKQIVQQLTSRPKQDAWPDDPGRQQIANLISKAIADEKCIDPPSIHPKDTIEVLFWGAYDDLTPLIFLMAFRDEYGVDLPREDIVKFWQDHWSVKDVVDYCVNKTESSKSAA